MGIVKLFEKYCEAGDMKYLATTVTTTNSDITPSQQLDDAVPTMSNTIGFLDPGQLGKPTVKRLFGADFRVLVYARRGNAAEQAGANLGLLATMVEASPLDRTGNHVKTQTDQLPTRGRREAGQ